MRSPTFAHESRLHVTEISAGFPAMSNGRTVGDSSGNCRIDLIDYRFFLECWFPFGGPGVPFGPACADQFDTDGDSDLDLKDFSRMQNAFGR